MCIMLTKPANVKLNRDAVWEGYLGNPHGSGFAYAEDGMIQVFRDPKIKFLEFWDMLQSKEHLPMLIHFRFATHGSKTVDNTHPFLIDDGRYAIAHNGIIDIDTEGDESDTRAFIRQHIEYYNRKYPGVIEDPKWLADTKLQIGWSKLAFMRNDGEFFYVNKETGVHDHGCWWSNDGYKPSYHMPMGVAQNRTKTYYNEEWARDWGDDYDDYRGKVTAESYGVDRWTDSDRKYWERMEARTMEATSSASAIGDDDTVTEEDEIINDEMVQELDAAESARAFLEHIDDCLFVTNEDLVCCVCNTVATPPYLIDKDTLSTMCSSCSEYYSDGGS